MSRPGNLWDLTKWIDDVDNCSHLAVIKIKVNIQVGCKHNLTTLANK